MRGGVEPEVADLRGEIAAGALHQRVEASDELGESEGLREVVVTAGREAGEPVGKRVPRRQEDDRCTHSLCAERLDDVAAVRVGQADVDDDPVQVSALDHREHLGGVSCRDDVEALLAKAARHERA